ncbi:MAG TPA: T9SS type A sorting domain-containing protein [Prolixibacteraceae bacterium]|nr:T9SS type A sorting domain-containing protein [Prolixibacteraceae bacterium]
MVPSAKILLVLSISLSVITQIPAKDVMRIIQKDGTVTEFPVDEIRKLTFLTSDTTVTSKQYAMVASAVLKLKAWPNPADNCLNVGYHLEEDGNVLIEVYNLRGGLVFSDDKGDQLPGDYIYQWNAQDVPAGNYLFRVRQNNAMATEKILFIK